MPLEVIMPRLGLTMEEGTVARWIKMEGEEVKKGELLLEVQTEKAIMEVEAPASGILRILVAEGETVPVAQVIAYILAPGEELVEEQLVSMRVKMPPEPKLETAREDIKLAQPTSTVEARPEERAKASPLARRLADDKGVDLSKVKGTGPRGRITEQDVLDFEAKRPLPEAEFVTPGPIQRITAQRLTASFTSTPHFYLTVEAKARKLVELREMLVPTIKERSGVRLTFTDILVASVARVLKSHPLVNASWENGKIKVAREVNIGIATAVREGLVVPVIKGADTKSLEEIAKERTELAEKALEGKLKLEEMEEGTFTLTNLGMFGVDEFSAIINPPQSAVLAVGRIAERPVIDDGQVVARPTIWLTLTLDHRVLDGAEGARFLSDLRVLLEEAEPGMF